MEDLLTASCAMQPHLYQSPEGMPEAPDAWEPAGWREYFAPGNAPPNYGRDPHQIDQEGTLEHDAEVCDMVPGTTWNLQPSCCRRRTVCSVMTLGGLHASPAACHAM